MIINKSMIPKTNIRKQLDKFRRDLNDSVYEQVDAGLDWSGWEMITGKVNNATPESLNAVCIIDIINAL